MSTWTDLQHILKSHGYDKYNDYLQSEHWRDLRRRKGVYSCSSCSARRTLVVHHVHYRNLLDVSLDDLVVLCQECHDDFHQACRHFKVCYVGIGALQIALSEQKVALSEGIEILEGDGQDKRVIPVHELTYKQAQQAFNGSGKRTPAQQRTWLNEQKAKALPTASYGKDYRVFKNEVQTKVPGRWPKSLLLEWLAQME